MRYVIGMAFFLLAPLALLAFLVVAFSPAWGGSDSFRWFLLAVSPFFFFGFICGYDYCAKKLARMA